MQTILGKIVKELRLKEGLSLRGLGGKIGKSYTYIWNIENLDFYPRMEEIILLAAALGTTSEYLLCVKDVSGTSASDTEFIKKYKKMDAAGKEKLLKICDIL